MLKVTLLFSLVSPIFSDLIEPLCLLYFQNQYVIYNLKQLYNFKNVERDYIFKDGDKEI